MRRPRFARRGCWRCLWSGGGWKPGEVVPRELLTGAQVAEELVLGGRHYEAVWVPCPHCGWGAPD